MNDKMREEFEAWFWFEFHKDSDVAFYWYSVFYISGNGEYCGVACNAYWTVWQAGWQASRAALPENHFPDAAKMVPDGWQLVPMEPTEAMISEVIDAGTLDEDDVAYFWDSMLAAAPKLEGGAA